MRVGGTYEWYYDRGVWKEKKIAPDKWEFTYSVKKTRAWRGITNLFSYTSLHQFFKLLSFLLSN
jgi:hypothetical protein